MTTDHRPIRPSWTCVHCGDEWPCAPRRDELIDEAYGSRVHLALLMVRYFTDALDDHPDTPPGQLYTRFVGWVRRPNPGPRTTS